MCNGYNPLSDYQSGELTNLDQSLGYDDMNVTQIQPISRSGGQAGLRASIKPVVTLSMLGVVLGLIP